MLSTANNATKTKSPKVKNKDRRLSKKEKTAFDVHVHGFVGDIGRVILIFFIDYSSLKSVCKAVRRVVFAVAAILDKRNSCNLGLSTASRTIEIIVGVYMFPPSFRLLHPVHSPSSHHLAHHITSVRVFTIAITFPQPSTQALKAICSTNHFWFQFHIDCLHGFQIRTGVSGHWRLFVLVSSFICFCFLLRVLD